MNPLKNRIGEKYVTNEGYTIEIIEYFGAFDCTIQFQDGTTVKNRIYQNILNGNIKNPYHKSVWGVGYFGIGKYNSKTHCKIYQTWQGMLERCYDTKFQSKHPTYKGCLVDKVWHNFQNFAEWFEENYKEGFVLDKDILFKGNKIYSPETCCFVPHEINALFVKNDANRGKYPVGVVIYKSKFRSEVNTINKSIYLGSFDTPEEAFQAYKIAKEKHIKETAEKYKGLILDKVYQAMYAYKIKIDD